MFGQNTNTQLLYDGYTLVNEKTGTLVRNAGFAQENSIRSTPFDVNSNEWTIYAKPSEKFSFIDYIGIDNYKF